MRRLLWLAVLLWLVLLLLVWMRLLLVAWLVVWLDDGLAGDGEDQCRVGRDGPVGLLAVTLLAGKKGMFFGWVFFLISSAHLHVRPMPHALCPMGHTCR